MVQIAPGGAQFETSALGGQILRSIENQSEGCTSKKKLTVEGLQELASTQDGARAWKSTLEPTFTGGGQKSPGSEAFS